VGGAAAGAVCSQRKIDSRCHGDASAASRRRLRAGGVAGTPGAGRGGPGRRPPSGAFKDGDWDS
jgi:hypothetical protein